MTRRRPPARGGRPVYRSFYDHVYARVVQRPAFWNCERTCGSLGEVSGVLETSDSLNMSNRAPCPSKISDCVLFSLSRYWIALRAVSMRDARQQGEWLYIGRIRSDLRDQRLRMTAMTIATSLSAKVLSHDAVLVCDRPRPARHAIPLSALGGQHVGPAR